MENIKSYSFNVCSLSLLHISTYILIHHVMTSGTLNYCWSLWYYPSLMRYGAAKIEMQRKWTPKKIWVSDIIILAATYSPFCYFSPFFVDLLSLPFHPCLLNETSSSWNEISFQRKRVNSKKHFRLIIETY